MSSGSAVFAQLTVVLNTQNAQTRTDHATSNSCGQIPHLCTGCRRCDPIIIIIITKQDFDSGSASVDTLSVSVPASWNAGFTDTGNDSVEKCREIDLCRDRYVLLSVAEGANPRTLRR